MKFKVFAVSFLLCALAQANPQQFKCRYPILGEDEQEVTLTHFNSGADILNADSFRISLTDGADPLYFERLDREKVLTAPIDSGLRFKGQNIFGILTLRDQVLFLKLGGKDGYGKKINVWDFVCRALTTLP